MFKKTMLWKKQYAPREKILLEAIDAKAGSKFKKFSTSRKVSIIDSMQAKGMFDKRL